MEGSITLENVFMSFLVPAVVGLIVWVWALWKAHHALDKQVAELYTKKSDLLEIKQDVRDIRRLVEKLCLKLHVPAVSED